MNKNIIQAIKANNLEGTLKEKCDELMKIEGMMRGDLLRSNFTYLEEKEGDFAIERMEKKLEEMGYPLKFKEINTFKWYKDPFCSVFMISFVDEFGWGEKDIFNLGRFSPRYSMVIKIALRHILSLKRAFDYAPNLWRRNVDYGILHPHEFNEKEKYMIFRLKEYALHPLVCIYIKGCLTSLFEQIGGKEKIKVEEKDCIFKGADYHEYEIRWK